MKKLLLALSVASLFAAPAMAEGEETLLDTVDTTIATNTVSSTNLTIQGQLVAPTCSILAEDQNKVIELAPLLTTDLAEGITAQKDFKITLERCPQVEKQVSLHFNVPEDQLDGAYLKNALGTVANAAGASLKITQDSNEIDLSKNKGEQGISSYDLNNPTSANPKDYNFKVEYVKATGVNTINPGLVQATLPVTVIYK